MPHGLASPPIGKGTGLVTLSSALLRLSLEEWVLPSFTQGWVWVLSTHPDRPRTPDCQGCLCGSGGRAMVRLVTKGWTEIIIPILQMEKWRQGTVP